jgi:predicted dehydrogenase
MGEIRVGVVGLGSMGRRHLETLGRTAGAKVTAVASTSAEKRREVNATLGIPTVEDYRQLVGLIDAVVIALPTIMHCEAASFFMEQGIHVLLEKPIAATIAEAQRLTQLAQTAGVVFAVGHIERFNPAYRCLQQIVQQQAPKGPVQVQAYRMGPYDGRSSDVSIELDLMIHDIDAIAGLFPQYQLQLKQALGMTVVSSLSDNTITYLDLYDTQNGSKRGNAVLLSSRIADTRRRCLQVRYDNFLGELDFMNQKVYITREGQEREEVPVTKAFPLDGELADFINSVRQGTKPAVDGAAALQAFTLVRQAGDMIAAALG